jgi:ABC-2 type transport system ATP-binding protein
VVAQGTSDELRREAAQRYRLVVDGDAGWVRSVRGVHVVDVDGPVAVLEVAEAGADQALLRTAMSRGQIREFAPVVPALSELYREMVA